MKFYVKKFISKKSQKECVGIFADVTYRQIAISFDPFVIQDFLNLYGSQYADFYNSMKLDINYSIGELKGNK